MVHIWRRSYEAGRLEPEREREGVVGRISFSNTRQAESERGGKIGRRYGQLDRSELFVALDQYLRAACPRVYCGAGGADTLVARRPVACRHHLGQVNSRPAGTSGNLKRHHFRGAIWHRHEYDLDKHRRQRFVVVFIARSIACVCARDRVCVWGCGKAEPV